ncbi:WhiB family transcriptional regulator [Streptomyces sp. SDr-06]|uniref:WhiB family transcriptional regulator n=1 Tax=Streptomyces sp. SDr-06 TaxID=2267702 RepID=UPI002950086C|nr:WhiB family transcriptional regulator [Streptomyces sp. SDr-06]
MEWLRPSQGWMRGAACVDADPELFFPVSNAGPALKGREAAKRICGRCAVSRECLKYSLVTGQSAGIWGGLAEEERAELRHSTLRTDC